MSKLFLDALDSFCQTLLVDKGYSRLTVREYRLDLLLFFRYIQKDKKLKPNEVTLDSFDRFDTASFLADLVLERKNSLVTRNRRLFSLRSFFKYLVDQELLPDDPTKRLTTAKTRTHSEPIYLRLAQAQTFLKAISDGHKKTKERDLLIMKIFLYCGLRVSELVQLNMENLTLDSDPSLKVLGKGEKERILPLHADITVTLKEYLVWRKKLLNEKNKQEKALFISTRGSRLGVRSIQLLVKNYAKKAGIEGWEKITPHKLRHTFATLLYKETKDIRILQELLGHASISTTQIYTHTDSEQRRKAVGRMPKL